MPICQTLVSPTALDWRPCSHSLVLLSVCTSQLTLESPVDSHLGQPLSSDHIRAADAGALFKSL